MARLLVTGGCGFIGSHLVEALVARGDRVRILDNLSTGKRQHAPDCAELIVGDVADPKVVAAALDGVEACFHLAAVASVARCTEDWTGSHRVNLTGTINVFDAARRRAPPPPVIYASSAAVYGDCPDTPLSETSPTRPLSAYGADKLGCELHARPAAEVHGVPNLGFRFFNVYGPRQDPSSPYSGVISIFADRIGRSLPITIHGDGLQTRDFIYVGDVVDGLLAGLDLLLSDRGPPEARVFNLCTGVGTSVVGLADLLMTLAQRRIAVTHGRPREGDARASVGDPSRARAALGCSAAIGVEEGLERTLAWHCRA